MTISVAEPPANAFSLLENCVSGLGARLRSLSTAPGARVRALAPLPVFTLPVDAVANRSGLASVRPAGWQYVLERGDQPIAAAELSGSGEEVVYSHLNEGPAASFVVAGVASAEQFDAGRNGEWEIRILRIEALYVTAIWLHGNSDVLFPIDPAPAGLQPLQPYEAQRFLEILHPMAIARIAGRNAPA